MTSHVLSSSGEIADWLRRHMRVGWGLGHPYVRSLQMANYLPKHSLFDWPTDRLETLGAGLISLGHPVSALDEGVEVKLPERIVEVSVDRSIPGDGPPEAYMLESIERGRPDYVGNSPEVLIELIRRLVQSIPEPIHDDRVQVGFPGQPSGELIYVGSWQWDIHGEARGAEFVARAAAATLAAIEAAERD